MHEAKLHQKCNQGDRRHEEPIRDGGINMGKNYPMRIYTDESSATVEWIAEYPDLPGCVGVGDTMEEALAEAESNKKLWIEAAEKMGADVPEPSEIFSNDYSGKFNIRLPKFLHKALVFKANEGDTSLNQLSCLFVDGSGAERSICSSLPDGLRHPFDSPADCCGESVGGFVNFTSHPPQTLLP